MRDLYMLMMPNMVLLDFAGPWQALHYANRAEPRLRLHMVGPQPDIALFTDLQLSGIQTLPESIADNAIVMVIGTHGHQYRNVSAEHMQSIAWLRDTVRPSHTLVTVCAGALFAAQAGLLRDKRCTTHHSLCPQLQEVEPYAHVRDDRIFVQDGNVYTSAGITAGLDLTLFLIGQWWSQTVAMSVARESVVYLRRSGDDPQLSPWLNWRNHLHPKIHQVQDIICQHPEQRLSLDQLADQVHISVRHLTRMFRDITGISLHDYQQRIRLDYAKRLLEETSHSLERVAELTGYGSARSLRRAWQSEHGVAPSEVRKMAH